MTTRGPSLLLAVFFVCVCVFIHVCISLSWGLSAIITSCGLITSLPKKSRDLKVIITWHVHFSSHLSPPPPPLTVPSTVETMATTGWNQFVTHTRLHFVFGEFLGFRWWRGGKMEVEQKFSITSEPQTHTQDYKSNFETFLACSYSNKVPFVLV